MSASPTQIRSDADIKKALEETSLRLKNVVELGKYSFDLEEKREQSLISQSGQILTAISLFSAGILMALPILLTYTSIPESRLMLVAGITGLSIIISLFLSIMTQWRFRYLSLMTAEEFRTETEEDADHYQFQFQYDYQWIQQLSSIQKAKRINNNKRVRFLMASMVFFLIGVTIFAAGIIVALCL